MGWFSHYLLLFTVYSFLGWVLETVFASVKKGRFINRGFLNGFFCPIYGFGAISILYCSRWISSNFTDPLISLLLSVFFATVLVTILEFITGFALEKLFNSKWWDYSDNYLNLMGYVCLKYSLLWGILAYLLIKVVHPIISQALLSLPLSMKDYIAIFILLYFLIDTTVSVIAVLDLRKVKVNYSKTSLNKYSEKIIRYKRFFMAFPKLLNINSGILNRDVRSILNEKVDKIKGELKNKFLS